MYFTWEYYSEYYDKAYQQGRAQFGQAKIPKSLPRFWDLLQIYFSFWRLHIWCSVLALAERTRNSWIMLEVLNCRLDAHIEIMHNIPETYMQVNPQQILPSSYNHTQSCIILISNVHPGVCI